MFLFLTTVVPKKELKRTEIYKGGRAMSNINITHFHSRGYEQTEVKTISSREVATMMEVKEHKVMLRKIDNLNEILIGANLCSLDFWVESTYKDTRGREQREYQVTKKGCELIAHKTEGEKGVVFTVRYMERFEQIEQVLHNPYANLSPELQMLIKLEQGQTELNQRVGDLENNMTIDYSQQETLRLAISTRVYQLLGNAKENAKLRSKVYSNLHRCIKKQFSVNSYKNIAVKEFEKARSMITTWMPDEIMMLAIQGAKSQMSLM